MQTGPHWAGEYWALLQPNSQWEGIAMSDSTRPTAACPAPYVLSGLQPEGNRPTLEAVRWE
jgi:hypothetical protein